MAKINEIDITSLTFQEGSAPTTPASTKWKMYTKTDGLYVVDDAGTETGPLAAGGGGLSLLDSSKLASPATNLQISSISGSGQHLKIVAMLRSDRSSTEDEVQLGLGNSTIDTGSNYGWWCEWNGVANSGASGTTAALIQANKASTGATATTNIFSKVEIDILDYADTGRYKQVGLVAWMFASTSQYYHVRTNGIWRATTAIDIIQLDPGTGTNWATGSEVWVYDY